ncbi:MAG: hypothetical protein FWE14_07985 [Lachnospiraceae bacterium]|nr:hypothetical protein [Lachnospiraceae bacterium]
MIAIPEYRSINRGYTIQSDKNDYFINNKDKRIFNGKYFDLYFTNSKNEFLEINIMVNDFVNIINAKRLSFNDVRVEYQKLLDLHKGFVQKYVLETLEYYLTDIKSNDYELLCAIYYDINKCDDTPLFFGISAKTRAIISLAFLLTTIDDKSFNMFLDEIKNDYRKVYLIREICYWLNPETQNSGEKNQDRYNRFNSVYEKIKKKILINDINIFDTKYYSRLNIYCFWEDKESVKKFKKHINENTIYRFLCDMVSTSVGTGGFGYSLKNKEVSEIIPMTDLEEILERIEPKNDKEKFILYIFANCKDKNNDYESIYEDVYFDYDLSNINDV